MCSLTVCIFNDMMTYLILIPTNSISHRSYDPLIFDINNYTLKSAIIEN